MDFAAFWHTAFMRLTRAARIHAAFNRLTTRDEHYFVRTLHSEVRNKLVARGLHTEDGQLQLAVDLASVLSAGGSLYSDLVVAIRSYFEFEALFKIPTVYWDDPPSYADLWVLHDRLAKQRELIDDFTQTQQRILFLFREFLDPIRANCPYVDQGGWDSGEIIFSVPLLHSINRLPDVLDHIIRVPFASEFDDTAFCEKMRAQLERNLILASGGDPTKPLVNTAFRFPPRSGIDDPEELVDTYLGGVKPLVSLFCHELPFQIPPSARFEHHWIVAPPGVGKSTLLQHMLLHDFERVAAGEASVIVIDSNRDLVKSIERLKRFGPGGDMSGRLVSIDVEDVEWPISLNIFDLGLDDTAHLSPRDREILLNSSTAMIDYIFRALLGAEMTSRQSTLFNFTVQLLLEIPHPTLDTLIDLMQPKALAHFSDFVKRLDRDAQRFFELKFDADTTLRATKSQVVDRLFAIKRIRALSRMFSARRTKLDLYQEMSNGKVILINAAKSLLQEDGVEIFTRFFLANILLAAEKRQLQPAAQRFPTYLYIDECQDVIRRDEKLPVILDQARKLKLGMVLAHQRLGQMQSHVLNALSGSTSIKFAANLADTNASAMAANMGTSTSFLQRQPDHHFAAFVRGTTEAAISVSVPLVDFNTMEKMTDAEFRRLRDDMRRKYATSYRENRSSAVEGDKKPVDADSSDSGSTTW